MGRRRARLESGEFAIEGVTLLREALNAGSVPLAVYVDCEIPLNDAQRSTVEDARSAGAPIRHVVGGVLARVADTVTPSPIISTLKRTTLPIDALSEVVSDGRQPADAANYDGLRRTRAIRNLDGPLLVLAGVSDPGNAGTLMRSAEAAGISAVVFCAGSVDPFGPKTVRSSAGAVVHVPVIEADSLAAALDVLSDIGYTLIGTVPSGGEPYDVIDLSGRVAFVLGNEAHGLADDMAGRCDRLVTIPMVGRSESLNVAMAGTLLCFESLRQARLRRRDLIGRNP